MPGPLYPLQPTFARGEISPRLFSRADIDHWKMSLAECVNFMVLKQGGLRRRSGTEWINQTRDMAKQGRLIPFVFSIRQAYIIEFGDAYLRAYANGGIIENSSTVTIDIATDVITWTAHPLADGNEVVFTTTGALPTGITAGTVYYASDITTDTFKIATSIGGAAINLTGSQSGTHTATAPLEVVTPYEEDEIFEVQYAQSADILYLAHPSHNQRTLTRTTATRFSLSALNPVDGPYLGENTTGTTMTPSGTSGSVTISASSVAGVNDGLGFQSSDVGRPISLQYSSKWYWAVITAVGSTTSVTALVKGLVEADGTVVGAFPGTGATGGWKLGAWSDVTGWPACVAFFQQRLVWGRTDTQPQTLWMSKAGELDNHATTEPAQDDDAITLTILAGEVNAIQWLVEGSDLLIGTSAAARTIGVSDTSQPFSATNLVQKRQTTFGSKNIQPVQVGSVAIYPSYYGKSLREFLYSFQQNAYIAPELTILSEHMLRSGIKQMTYAQDHDSVIWCCTGIGELVGLTYERDQQIVACHRHRIGGFLSTINAPELDADLDYGFVESVASIPGTDRHEVWMIVRRTIREGAAPGGYKNRRYIERINKTFEAMDKKDAVFVDSSYQYVGSATDVLSGIAWLKGETVSILGDGAVKPDQAVTGSGGLTFDKEMTTITFGLKYLSRAKTLPIAQGIGDGTGMGRNKRVIAAKIDFYETGYLEIASPSRITEPEVVTLRRSTDPMDDSPPLRDGFITTKFDSSWKDAGQVIMQTDKPLPATIRSITPVFEGEP